MANEAKERFAGENMMRDILDRGPDSATELEKDVLRARKSYLTREEIEKFNLFPKEDEAKIVVPQDNEPTDNGKAGKGKAGKGK